MSKEIRIGIAEDHDLVRQGIVNLINDEDDLTVTVEASNGSELLNELRTKTVDIILMDIEMPVMDGRKALKVVSKMYPKVKVIMLSMHYSDDFIVDSVGAGARGFLPKNSDIEKVIDAIHAVHKQGYYFDDKMSRAMLIQVLDNKSIKPEFSEEPLTKREREIVERICEGKTNKDMAEELCISIRTIEVHRKNISQKTQATNVAGVVIYAIKNGIYSI